MPKKDYREKLTRQEVLDLFNQGNYIADIETGKVYSRKGKELYTFSSKRSPNLWVRIFKHPGYRCTPIAHIIWMVGTGFVVPDGWEVHHRNLNPLDNRFTNLLCVHPLDHDKLHAELEEVPF